MYEIIFLLFGLFLLVKGSGYFVKSASSLAKGYGVSEFTIGLTLVAVGTSLPELVSSIFASVKHESGLIVGTIVGANVANICLIVGLAAVLSMLKTEREMLERDGYIMLGIFVLVLLAALDGVVQRWEGGILVVLFFAYTIFLFEKTPRGTFGFTSFVGYFLRFSYVRSLLKLEVPKQSKHETLSRDLLLIVTGGAMVVLGANILVEQAVGIASQFSLPPVVLGIFIAIGTTMPELSVTITATRQGLGNLVIGNTIGSCITNSLLIIGTSSLIYPLQVSPFSTWFVIPFMVFAGVLLLIFIRSTWSVRRLEGALLLTTYAAFLALTFYFS